MEKLFWIFYKTLQSCNFYLQGSGLAQNINKYNAFGQDTLIGDINYSLNFGLEMIYINILNIFLIKIKLTTKNYLIIA